MTPLVGPQLPCLSFHFQTFLLILHFCLCLLRSLHRDRIAALKFLSFDWKNLAFGWGLYLWLGDSAVALQMGQCLRSDVCKWLCSHFMESERDMASRVVWPNPLLAKKNKTKTKKQYSTDPWQGNSNSSRDKELAVAQGTLVQLKGQSGPTGKPLWGGEV